MNEHFFYGTDYGPSEAEQVETLTKALQAGYQYTGAPGAMTDGGALMSESLDTTLHAVTWTYKMLKIWPLLPKDKAYNTVEEYNRQTSYGEQQDGGFFPAEQGLPPQEHTGKFNRQVVKIKYIGTTRIVTHPMSLVRTVHAPAVAIEIKNGTMWILEQMERQLWEANGYFQDQGGATPGEFTGSPTMTPLDDMKYNGMDEQIRWGNSDPKAKYTGWDGYNPANTVVKNMFGNVPDEDDVTDWAYLQASNVGNPTHAFFPLKAVQDISRTILPKERVVPTGQEGRGGFQMTEFISGNGVFKMVGSKFLDPRRGPRVQASPSSPIIPGGWVTDGNCAASADTTSTLTAGWQYYRIAALNVYGESLAFAQIKINIIAGQKVTITLPAGVVAVGSTPAANAYAVYHSTTDGSGWEFVGLVSDIAPGGGGGAVFIHKGRLMAGLGHAYLMQLDSANVVWRQLAPLMKMDLAITGPAYRWMQLLYGTPIVTAPLHHAIMDNIGRA